MTIGANLNGGSLTLGSANATTSIRGTANIPSGTINASYFTMFSSVIDSKPTAWLDTIQSNLNTQLVLGFYNASEVFLGSPNTPNIVIGGDKGTVKIANVGLVAGARVYIATGTNATGSEVYLGSSTLTKCTISAGGEVKLDSNNIIIGSALSGNGNIDIAGYANTTTGYISVGSRNLDASYIKARTIFINHDGGNVTVGNTPISNTYIKGNTVGLGDDGGNVYIGTTNPISGATSTVNIRGPLTIPLTIGYSYNNDLTKIGGYLIQTYSITSSGFATTRVYCCFPQVPVGIYQFTMHIRCYGLSVASPFMYATILLTDTQQTNRTIQVGNSIGGNGGEWYSAVYSPSTGAGYSLQPSGNFTTTSLYKYPCFSYSTDADTQGASFSLSIYRIG